MSTFKSAALDGIKDRCRDVGGCWEWITNAKSAQRRIHPQMRTEEGGPPKLVRRVAFEHRYGKSRAEGRYLVPKCGSAFCVNPEHQWALTKDEKLRRMGIAAADSTTRPVTNSFTRRKNGTPKLTLEKANEIRNSDAPTKELAAQYGVCLSMIWQIKSGKLWRDHTNPFTQLFAANDSARRSA